MLVITGCCWPKGISRGGVLAACCEGSRRCRSRTGSEPGQPANRVLRSDPVGTGVSGQAGWRRETDQTSQRNCQTSRDTTRGRLCRSELDARGQQAYGFRTEIKLKSEIPVIGKKDRLFLFMLCKSCMEISTVPLAIQERIVQPPKFELVG